MKKKIWAVFLLAFLLALSSAPMAWAAVVASGECGAQGSNATWSLDDAGVLTISGRGEMADYEPGGAPWRNYNIENIVIEDGITRIGNCTFSFSSVLNVIIGDSVNVIGYRAFFGCGKLQNIEIPNSVKYIEQFAFSRCDNIETIYIPASVLRIEEYVFDECFSLQNIVVDIENKQYSSFDGALYSKDGLTLIVCPAGKEYFEIHSGTVDIEGDAFGYCKKLKKVIMPESVTAINGSYVFGDCSSLEKITLSSNIENLGWRKFQNCVSLSEIAIPGKVTELNATFYGCTNLKTVYLPVSVTEILSDTFYHCYNLEKVIYAGTKEQWNKIRIYDGNVELKNAEIIFQNNNVPDENNPDNSNPENPGQQTVAVRRVTLNKTSLALNKGDSEVLTATVSPDNATDKTVTWSSSDLAVATVVNGQVTAVKAGEAMITAAAGGKTATGKVTVTGSSVALDHTQLSIVAGSSVRFVLSATVTGNVLSDAIIWSSSDTAVATVAGGEITGLTAGTATITATLAEDTDAKAECVVNVKGNPDNLSVYVVTFDANGGVIVGDSQAQVLDGEEYTLPGASRSGYSFRGWQNNADASVTAGGAVYVITADTSFKAVWGSTGGGGGKRPSQSAKDEEKQEEVKPVETKPADEVKPGSATTGNINQVFDDVRSGDWFAKAVVYAYNQGIMQGTDTRRFAPNDQTTRAMIVTMLYRMESEPVAGAASFSDVANGQWFSKAIAWAADKAIVKGYETGAFGLNDAITREQLAAILYRFAEYKGYDTTAAGALSDFADGAKVSAWSAEAMQWAVGCGIINGMEDNTLAPAANATRAEVATMLMRFSEQFAE